VIAAAVSSAYEEKIRQWAKRHGVPLAQQPPAPVAEQSPPASQPLTPAPETRAERAKPRRAPNPTAEARSHVEGGYARVSNDVIEHLMRVMPDSAFKAYAYACKIARLDGTFFISHDTLAEKIGRKDHTSGQRAMALLIDAGLIRRVRVGRGTRANDYQLVPVDDVERAKERLAAGLPWTTSSRSDTAATA
jgi:hypothetical protein